jgi:hypothetical protein
VHRDKFFSQHIAGNNLSGTGKHQKKKILTSTYYIVLQTFIKKEDESKIIIRLRDK